MTEINTNTTLLPLEMFGAASCQIRESIMQVRKQSSSFNVDTNFMELISVGVALELVTKIRVVGLFKTYNNKKIENFSGTDICINYLSDFLINHLNYNLHSYKSDITKGKVCLKLGDVGKYKKIIFNLNLDALRQKYSIQNIRIKQSIEVVTHDLFTRG
ncbi:MAG: hypothetical protein WC222_01635 [Parachlamydiales bacterium]